MILALGLIFAQQDLTIPTSEDLQSFVRMGLDGKPYSASGFKSKPVRFILGTNGKEVKLVFIKKPPFVEAYTAGAGMRALKGSTRRDREAMLEAFPRAWLREPNVLFQVNREVSQDLSDEEEEELSTLTFKAVAGENKATPIPKGSVLDKWQRSFGSVPRTAMLIRFPIGEEEGTLPSSMDTKSITIHVHLGNQEESVLVPLS